MKRKLICTILAVVVLLASANITTFASGNKAQEVIAKTAYISGVAEDGSNLNNETIDGSLNEIDDTILSIKQNRGNLVIHGRVMEQNITINVSPVGKSENEVVVFFGGESSGDYTIVHAAYEKASSTSKYFTEYAKTFTGPDTVLKLYLKENNTRNYLLIEAYGFQLEDKSSILQIVPANNILGAWGANEFAPVSHGEVQLPNLTRAITGTQRIKYYDTFYWLGEDNYNEIVLEYYLDYMDVPRGGEGVQINRVTVYSKACTFSVNTQLNSNTDSALHVRKAELVQTAIPGTAWRGTMISGKVYRIAGSSPFAAKLSVSIGILSVGLDIGAALTSSGTVQLNSTYTGYTNSGSTYTKNSSTKMDENFVLNNVGTYFEVVGYLRDYGNATTAYNTYKSRWNINLVRYTDNYVFGTNTANWSKSMKVN